MQTLLEKTREINKLLQRSGKIGCAELVKVLRDVIVSNIYIVSNEGHVRGYALINDFECDIMRSQVLEKSFFPKNYTKWLADCHATLPNVELQDRMCAFKGDTKCVFDGKYTTIVPIYGGGERLATLILAKFNIPFNEEDLILSEYAATVIGIEILHERTVKIEEAAHKRAMVQIAFSTLSYSELEAIINIIGALEGNEGLLVASKIADQAGITRSVIVNALRKFESAGLIETRSLGMKGTYIKLLNEFLLEELKKKK